MFRSDPIRDAAALAHRRARQAHWDAVARRLDRSQGLGRTYHRRLGEIYRALVAPGLRVLELGCGRGDLLASLRPAVGVGVDFSPAMIARARARHRELRFFSGDAHEIELEMTFDVVILSDLVNDVWDAQAIFERIGRMLQPCSRVILNSYSRLWEEPLALAEALRLARPTLRQNWLTIPDVTGLLDLAGMEVIRSWHEVLWPLPIPVLEPLLNRIIVRYWPFTQLALANFILARPRPSPSETRPAERVSVVVPVRNESGNIAAIFDRTPEMGAGTELVFVEGHSMDESFAVIEREIAAHPGRCARLVHQVGEGKGDAVRTGFAHAGGDILIILDADLTVPPEDLPRFYQALRSGRGELINGVRLVYPIEGEAMRLLNLIANKLFGAAFSWLLGQPVKDTLCGTKALWRRDYERIQAHRSYFGDFDPFGDFDLLFGAARLNMKITDLPVRYRRRVYGTSNIARWKHGWLLLRMVFFAAGRIKFV